MISQSPVGSRQSPVKSDGQSESSVHSPARPSTSSSARLPPGDWRDEWRLRWQSGWFHRGQILVPWDELQTGADDCLLRLSRNCRPATPD
jgi:hypothetical protein